MSRAVSHSTITRHHVPPQCYRLPDTFKIRVIYGRHSAYHELLGIPASYSEASRILAKQWLRFCDGTLEERKRRAFITLFGIAITLTEAMKRLEKEWWTRRKTR